MIAVIDYGAGNLRNVCKALEHVGASSGATIVLTDDPREIERADKVVLPGVGAFADCRAGLKSRGLWEPTRELALAGKPLLGICVGMQLLFDLGEEMGEWDGLGLIPGRVVRFDFNDDRRQTANDGRSLSSRDPGSLKAAPEAGSGQFSILNSQFKVPHIGWNQLAVRQPEHPLMRAVPNDGYAYFVHSFHAADVAPAQILTSTDYGYDFPSVVARDNVWGIQFHPEKSQDVGLQMLRNFVEFETRDWRLELREQLPVSHL